MFARAPMEKWRDNIAPLFTDSLTFARGANQDPQQSLALLNDPIGVADARCEAYLYRELELPPQIWIRRYDDQEKVIEESLYRPDGSLVFRWIYLYNEKGRKIEANLHGGEGSLLATSFYDEHEKLIKRFTYKCGRVDKETCYEHQAEIQLQEDLIKIAA